MFQVQLINAVVEWEWKLKIAAERQKNLKGEPVTDFAVASRPGEKQATSVKRQTIKNGQAIKLHSCDLSACS